MQMHKEFKLNYIYKAYGIKVTVYCPPVCVFYTPGKFSFFDFFFIISFLS